MENKEKYNQISTNKLKTEVSEKNKWKLVQQVQEEYKKCHSYREVARNCKLYRRTVKKYINTKEPPINGNKNREYVSKLDLYKNKIIEMNNNGFGWKKIKEVIELEGYKGSDSLLRTFFSQNKKRKN